MENKEVKKTAEIKKEKVGEFGRASKRDILIESLRALAFCVLGVLLGTAQMPFETVPLGFALLAASTRQAPFVFLGLAIGSLSSAR